MGRRCLTKGFKSTLGGKKGSAKKKLISEFSGVGINDPKLNKGTSRQRRIKDTLDWQLPKEQLKIALEIFSEIIIENCS